MLGICQPNVKVLHGYEIVFWLTGGQGHKRD